MLTPTFAFIPRNAGTRQQLCCSWEGRPGLCLMLQDDRDLRKMVFLWGLGACEFHDNLNSTKGYYGGGGGGGGGGGPLMLGLNCWGGVRYWCCVCQAGRPAGQFKHTLIWWNTTAVGLLPINADPSGLKKRRSWCSINCLLVAGLGLWTCRSPFRVTVGMILKWFRLINHS